jgi:hypothetical protein
MGSIAAGLDFAVTRLGVIMSPREGQPHEAWGVLNPGGVRSPRGAMHLFPRLIAEGNYSEVVSDPKGVPSLAILHRPTTRVHFRRHRNGPVTAPPPGGDETQQNIWISYVPVEAAVADIANLTAVRRHERVMAPERSWETQKVGTGAPPVRLPYGWVLPYHAVSAPGGRPRYCMGVAILDGERSSRVLYRTPEPILEPHEPYERNGLVDDVVFPSATDLRADGALDVNYGAADHVIAGARVSLPSTIPAVTSNSNGG